jgi:hypothetical protein
MRIVWTGLTAAAAGWLFWQLVIQAPQYTSGSLAFGELLLIVGAFLAAVGSAVGAPVVVWRGYPERRGVPAAL